MNKKLKYILLFIILTFFISGCSTQRGFPPIGNIQNMDQVDVHLFRGSQPNYIGLQILKQNHITLVINLRDKDAWDREETILEKFGGITYLRMPLSGIKSPPKEEIETILAAIDEETKKGGNTFIHCQFGCERTGTVIACYQIRYNHTSNLEAQKEADMYGMSKLAFPMRRFIRNFK